VADIRDIAHIADFITGVEQVSINYVKADKCAAITQVYVVVYSWAAYIHADPAGYDGLEYFLFARKAVV
jgi:hypothetical protein